MGEEWKELKIKDMTNNLFISTIGRIKSVNVIRKCLINKKGYNTISIKINKKNPRFYVHRLVAKVFIPNPENKPEVNHIDGNKLNNNIENLEWCTRSENNQHAFNIGLKVAHSKLKDIQKIETEKKKKSVYLYDINGKLLNSFSSINEAQLTLNYYNISRYMKYGKITKFGIFKHIKL